MAYTMKKNLFLSVSKSIVFITVFISVFGIALSKEKRAMTVDDVMKFKSIAGASISDNGKWIAYSAVPDRGDPEAFFKATDRDTSFSVKLGERPQFSKNSFWAVMSLKPKGTEFENAEKDKPKSSMAIINLQTGEINKFENIKSFKFSEDSKWLVYQINSETQKAKEGKDQPKNRIAGSDLVLRQLETSSELNLQNVTEFEFDSLSQYLTYIVAEPNAKKNGIFSIDLKGGAILPIKISGKENTQYSNIRWTTRAGRLAFISGKEKKDGDPDSCIVNIWDNLTKEMVTAVSKDKIPEGWFVPFKNSLSWTKDGKRLFFGFKPLRDTVSKDDKVTFNDSTYTDVNTILKKTELDLWHWNDSRIKTNRKNWWSSNKDSIFRSVYSIDTKNVIQLSNEQLADIVLTESANYTIGFDQSKYLKAVTWDNDFADIYLINLITGAKKLIAEKVPEGAHLSPKGKFAVYYKNKDWFQYNCESDTTYNLTKRVGVPFHDVDYDEPADPPSYGFGGWLENESAVIIYDKYDIWKFHTNNHDSYLNQTGAEGRESKVVFRLYNLEPEKEYYSQTGSYLTRAFSEKTKEIGIFELNFDILGTQSILFEKKRYNILDKSKNGLYLFTKESYEEFPDLWVAYDSTFKNIKKFTDVNPVMSELNFGTAELIEWTNFEKDTLQGYFIKPDNFDPNKKYPLLVYYYDRFSQMMYNFFQPRMNHRPCYPLYTGDGYIVFMPDIKYKIGSPGPSAISCVVSGVRKLASKGFIDTNAIAIQGHSWGGYQTAYMITQTTLFAAACAGAPVGNMTSAYSGIRLESGLARQMQYEKQQSRIGGNLWDSLSSYINNSPVFQAKGTKTPFLIMFGDEDNAVPWQQGIELYMAYRRLNKECYMLQYRNEPHIPRKYQNKLDYSIRMKEFFDHYCLKKPAPEWMTSGIEYRGK